MEIILTPKESEEYFYNALCNGLSYICDGYDLTFDYMKKDYQTSRQNLIDARDGNFSCFEDVLMQMLRDGFRLDLVDEDGEDRWSIRLRDVHERVNNTPIEHLVNMIKGNDDAVTADVILQTVFINDVIFG
jgi:hypothetical protein